MVMWGVGEDDTKGGARPLPTFTYVAFEEAAYIDPFTELAPC